MVTTNRVDSHQLAQGNSPKDVGVGGYRNYESRTSSPSRKRKVEEGADYTTNKRRQLTPLSEGTVLDGRLASQPAIRHNATVESNLPVHSNGFTESSASRAQLDAAARSLLKLFTHTTFDYLTAIVSRRTSLKGKAYRVSYAEFQAKRGQYPDREGFIYSSDLKDVDGADTLARRTNIVTFAASMLGSRDRSFRQLNDHFFEVFVRKNGRLNKQPAEILLGLKTQAYICQAIERGGIQHELLDKFFPSSMAQSIQALRPESSAGLAASEHTFIKQLTNRRRSLSEKTTTEEIRALKEKYRWNETLDAMIQYMKHHFDELAEKRAEDVSFLNDNGEPPADVDDSKAVKPAPLPAPAAGGDMSDGKVEPAKSQAKDTALQLNVEVDYSNQAEHVSHDPLVSPAGADIEDILAMALRAADQAAEEPQVTNPYHQIQNAAGSSHGQLQYRPTIPQNPYAQTPQSPAQQAPTFTPPMRQSAAGVNSTADAMHPGGQSYPTHQLYEMARQATTGRATQPNQRRTGTQSQRRPWTREEEEALMQGLDTVKGPHWSMILQLYGPGGKMSEVLKDRNQVQLKDKARNLKLWFLKSNTEVPVNLRSVTGELKTRAPAAVRNAVAAAATQPHQEAVQHQAQQQSFDPRNSPYAPASSYAHPAPPDTSATPGFTQSMPATAPDTTQNGHTKAEQIESQLPADLDPWAAAADEAAMAAMAELHADMGIGVGANEVKQDEEEQTPSQALSEPPYAALQSVPQQANSNAFDGSEAAGFTANAEDIDPIVAAAAGGAATAITAGDWSAI